MSITISTDVFCEECGNWTAGATGTKPRPKAAREIAKSQGWAFFKRKDYCPDCWEQLQKAEREVGE